MIKNILAKFKPQPKRVEPNCAAPDYTDVIGGFWGNKIDWLKFDHASSDYRIVGWKPFDQRLSVGDVILAEGQQTWMWFVIEEIEYCRDPRDMFSASLRIMHQEVKPFEFPADAGTHVAGTRAA